MPKPKLPKGARSLGDIARMRGSGGEILKALRLEDTAAHAFSEPTRRGQTFQEKIGNIDIPDMEEAEKMYEKQKAISPKLKYMPKLLDADLIRRHRFASIIRKAGRLGAAASKLSAIGQIITLPSQIEEYKQMKKPLHKREQEASARRM